NPRLNAQARGKRFKVGSINPRAGTAQDDTLRRTLICGFAAVTIAASAAQSPHAPMATVYEGARLIVGDGRAPIENGAFVVQDGRITMLGARGGVTAPAGAARLDLAGKTVMPAWINVHVHIGYEGYTSWGADNYT